jgi:hypothetical protein
MEAEMARHHNAEGKQRNNINKRLQRVEREVKEMRAKTPIDPAQAMNMAAMSREAKAGERADYLKVRPGNAAYDVPVKADMKRLQGRSRNDTMSDRSRGSASPLGRRK